MIAHTGVDHVAARRRGAVVVGAYGLAWMRLPGRRSWRGCGAWIGGVALVRGGVAPVMETLAEQSFTGHMVQHLS